MVSFLGDSYRGTEYPSIPIVPITECVWSSSGCCLAGPDGAHVGCHLPSKATLSRISARKLPCPGLQRKGTGGSIEPNPRLLRAPVKRDEEREPPGSLTSLQVGWYFEVHYSRADASHDS